MAVSEIELSVEQVADLINSVEGTSAALTLMTKVPMSKKSSSTPVFQDLPNATWEGGPKVGTTGISTTRQVMTAVPLTSIIPVNNDDLDDEDFDIWGVAKAKVAEALGRSIDLAAFFGIGAPAAWNAKPVVVGATEAGQVETVGTGVDRAVDIASLGEMLGEKGYNLSGFHAPAGYNWRLAKLRTESGNAIYQAAGAPGIPGSLYGMPMFMDSLNVYSQQVAHPATELIAADFSKFVIGLRGDIKVELLDDGVIVDDAGKVLISSTQDRVSFLRATYRVGYQVENPGSVWGDRFPAAVLKAAA